MSREDVYAEVLEPMQRLFSPPRQSMTQAEIAKALGDYLEALERYDPEVLRAAWRSLREEYLRSSWPPIALVVLHCRRARPKPSPLSYAQQRAEEDRLFNRFCELRGLDPRLMRRPNLWWLQPRDLWRSDWKESEVPLGERPNMRNSDGTRLADIRIE